MLEKNKNKTFFCVNLPHPSLHAKPRPIPPPTPFTQIVIVAQIIASWRDLGPSLLSVSCFLCPWIKLYTKQLLCACNKLITAPNLNINLVSLLQVLKREVDLLYLWCCFHTIFSFFFFSSFFPFCFYFMSCHIVCWAFLARCPFKKSFYQGCQDDLMGEGSYYNTYYVTYHIIKLINNRVTLKFWVCVLPEKHVTHHPPALLSTIELAIKALE